MAKVTISVVLGSGADDQATSGKFAVRRVEEGVDETMLVLSDWKDYTLDVEATEIEVETGVLYESREVIPRGEGTRFWVGPATAMAYKDIPEVVPVFPTVGILGDDLVTGLAENPASDFNGVLTDLFNASEPGSTADSATAANVSGGPLTQAALAAAVADPTDPLGVSAKVASVAQLVDEKVIPLRAFLAANQPMPNGGIPDQAAATALLQLAINAANTLYTADGITRVIEVPSGVFATSSRLTIPPGGGFGIRGQGRGVTVFLTAANNSFLGSDRPDGPWAHPDFYYSNMIFESFTVDGQRQPSTGTYSSGLKGFIMHHFDKTTFYDVEVKNCHATGFGLDDFNKLVMLACWGSNNGKGRYTDFPNPDQRYGSGSDLGAGFGGVKFESALVMGCTFESAASAGIFMEHLGRQETPYEAAGMRVIGNLLVGNNVGILDAGVKGATIQGNTIQGSTYAGLYIGRSLASEQGGVEGIASGNTFYDNENGVILAGNALGGYDISGNTIVENRNHGIWFPDVAGAFIGQKIRITGNTIKRNGGGGIVGENSRPIADIQISGNTIIDNGTDATKTRREGVVFLGPLSRPRVFRNRFAGNRGWALALLGSSVITASPRIEDNDLVGSRGGGMALEHSIADTSHILRNITDASTTVTQEISRPTPYGATTSWSGGGTTRTWEAGAGPTINTVTYDAIKGVATTNSPRVASPTVNVNPGDFVMLSIHAKAPANKNIQPAAVFGTTYVTGPITQGTGAWQRVHMLVAVPAGATQVRAAVVGASGDVEWTAGEELWASCANATFGSDLWQYIDGAQPGCAWLGSVGVSRSTFTIPTFSATPIAGGTLDFASMPDGPVTATTTGNHAVVGTGNSTPIYPLVAASGQGKRGAGGTASRSVHLADFLMSNGVVRATLGDIGDSSHELAIWADDQGNYISLQARFDATTRNYRLVRRTTAGGLVIINNTSTVASAAGDQIKIERDVVAHTLTVYVNDAAIFGGPVSVTDFNTSTKTGIVFTNTASGAEGWKYISVQAT